MSSLPYQMRLSEAVHPVSSAPPKVSHSKVSHSFVSVSLGLAESRSPRVDVLATISVHWQDADLVLSPSMHSSSCIQATAEVQ